ncbi:MAG: T9SS type A sorting domain-containing protein [Bacteroidetes bacterium]|nr:T9SS type A sorting domain-containing protein [Bacteroidota bacterium]
MLLLEKWYRVVVTCTNSGLSSTTVSYQVQVKPLPQIIITSNTPTCEGVTVNFFSVNNALGQSSGNSFNWAGPAGFSSNLSNPLFTNASAINVGYYYLTITNQFFCSSTDSVFVDVLPNPVLAEGLHIDASCNSGNDGVVDIDALNGQSPFLFNDGSNFNADGIFSGLSSGVFTIYADDANGCTSSIDVTITEPAPTSIANAGPDQSICEFDAALFGNTPFVGSGSWSFVSGGGIIDNVNDPLTTVSNLQQGINILRWTIKYNSCPDSSYDDVEINAGDVPTATISGNTDICVGNNTQIKIDFTGEAPWSYTYTDGSNIYGPFGTSNAVTFVNVSPSSSTSYALVSVVSDNCAGNVSGIANVTVSTAPPAGQTSALNGLPPYGCVGTFATISCTPVNRATGYEWDAPLGSYFDGSPLNVSPYSTTGTSTQITFGQPNGSGYLVCVKPVNGCGSAVQRCAWIRGITSVPASVTGPVVACENTTMAYSTGPIGGATGYTWSGTNGISIISGNGSQNVTAEFAPGFTQGNVCVSSNTTCYVSPSKCLTIKNSVATLPLITGPNGICPNPSPYFYNVPTDPGISSYIWNLPIATSGASTSNTIGISFQNNFSSGNICVKGVSICGVQSSQRCKTIVTGVPPTPSAITGSTSALCGQTVVYSSAAVQGALSYTWSIPAAATLNSGQGTNSIEVSFNSGSFTTDQICVSVNSGCPNPSAPRCISVKGPPANPGSIAANPTVICPGQEGVQFSVAAAPGNYFLDWLVPNDAFLVFGQGTNSINVDFGNSPGSIVAIASNPCGSAASTYHVDLNCRIAGSLKDYESTSHQKSALVVSPNPTDGLINIYFDQPYDAKVTITDVWGKEIFSNVIKVNQNKPAEIDLRGNKPGIYFLKVDGTAGVFERKIILTQ